MDRLLEFLLYAHGPTPYLVAFFVLLACGLGLPIPEDITLFAMGLISYYGLTDIRISIAVCLLGVLLGDFIIFFIGHKYGSRLLREGGFFSRFFPVESIEKAKAMFHRQGDRVIFIARFMPGLRAPTYFTAGTLHLPVRVFLFYDGLAALLSVPLLTSLVYYFGDHVDYVIQVSRKVQNGIALLVLGIVVIFVLKPIIMKRIRSSRTEKQTP